MNAHGSPRGCSAGVSAGYHQDGGQTARQGLPIQGAQAGGRSWGLGKVLAEVLALGAGWATVSQELPSSVGN